MYVLNYYQTKVYVYLNLDKTSTDNLASNVCLGFLNSDFHIFLLLEISDKIIIFITKIISIPQIDKILAKILT